MRAGQHTEAYQAARLRSAMPALVAALHAQRGDSEGVQAGYNLALRYYEERALWEARRRTAVQAGQP